MEIFLDLPKLICRVSSLGYLQSFMKRWIEMNDEGRLNTTRHCCIDKSRAVIPCCLGEYWVSGNGSSGSLIENHALEEGSVSCCLKRYKTTHMWSVMCKNNDAMQKTTSALFDTINTDSSALELKTEFIIILRVKSFRYIWLALDETLNRNKHVNKLCESLAEKFDICNHIKYKITT